MEDQIPGFIDFFKQIPDHRIERRKLHTVEEILLVTFCGVIAGCEGWDDLELFGKIKIDYLQQYLPFKNGAPSEDTLRRFFRVLDPAMTQFISSETIEKGHGRIEKRICTVTEDIDWLRAEHSHWKELRSVVEIESTRDIKGQVSIEKRYYISSHHALPDVISNAVRQHWGVENKLHWVLDVCFGDDQSRIRKGNAPRNMAVIKKTALNLLQIIKKERPRISLKRMRKLAGWDHAFLDTVLMAKF